MYLIIWDRMFGTFDEEREDEPITYGTVSQLETFDVMNIQVIQSSEHFTFPSHNVLIYGTKICMTAHLNLHLAF